MNSVASTQDRSQEQITFWNNFDELNSLARTLTRKITRRFNLRDITFTTVHDDLVQEAWSVLLECQQDPDLKKGQVISRVLWRLDDYVRTQVFQWDKNFKKDRPSHVRYEVIPEYQFRDDDDNSTFEIAADNAEVVSQPLCGGHLSLEEEVADIGEPELSGDELCQQFFQRWSGSDFLFHQVKLGGFANPDHPEMEVALYRLFCAEQTYRIPHQKLHTDVMRLRAYALMRRLQGAEDNVTIAAELNVTRHKVASYINAARKTLDRWLKLDVFQQQEALAFLYKQRPDIDDVSLCYTDRRDACLDPNDLARLDRLADVVVRKVCQSLELSREERGDLYEDLKQVAFVHLLENAAKGQTAGYAYAAAYRELRNHIFFQEWQKDPRFNRERDKHLALDIQHDNIDEFDRGEDSRAMPEPLLMHSPEKHMLWREWEGIRDKRWQKAKREIRDILLAMLPHQSQRSRKSAKVQAACLVIRLRYGYTTAELADELSLPTGTVGTHLRTARQRIGDFLELSTDEQAARLLRVYFGEEKLEDVPVCQLGAVIRPIHLRIDNQQFILAKNTRKRGDVEVYLRANKTVKTASGRNRAPSVYIGRPGTFTHADIMTAAAKLQDKLRQYAELPLAGD